MKQFTVLAVLLALLAAFGCAGSGENAPFARQGVLDLTAWDPEKDGPVRLDGEWEFYWDRLLTPEDFKSQPPPERSGYLSLPSSWNGFGPEGKKLGGTGYATLRLHVNPGPGRHTLGLMLYNIDSAYTLWLNGIRFAQSGTVGKSAQEEVPNPSSLIGKFQSDGNPLELVLQVSNHYRRNGGVFFSIRLGPAAAIYAEQVRQWGSALFFIGGLLVMGVYHLAVYYFRRKNISPLYFAVYCLLWMGNSLASESSAWAVRLFFPDLTIQAMDRFNLFCFFLTIPVGYQFMRSLYPHEFSGRLSRFIRFPAAGFVCCALFAPALVLSASVPVYYLFSLLLILYCLLMLYRAWKNGREGATFILAGFLILGLIGINDMLYDLQVIRSVFLIHVGMFIFILFQAFALALRFSRSFGTVERLSEELEENNLILSRMDRIKDEFLANTSHELRTPLSGIIGLSESLLDGAAGPLPPKAVEDLSLVMDSARRLAGLVNDILDFSLLENREMDLQKKAVDLRSLADIALAVSKPLALTKGLQTVNAVPEGTPWVDGDEDRLLQVFFNLLGNAIKFTERGEVRISAENRGEFVEVAFSDTGSGIPADRIESIFLPFEQVDGSATRASNGVGLGLAISRHLVKLHGGKLWAESTPGRGSIFRLTLPVCAAPDDAVGPVMAPVSRSNPLLATGNPSAEEIPTPALESTSEGMDAPPSNPSPPLSSTEEEGEGLRPPRHASPLPALNGGTPRILAVDDDPVNLQVIRNHLELAGMTVTTAANGAEAFALLDAGETFDLVLLDVMMPGMTGFEVCRRLRLRYSVAELPVIMLTAVKRISDLTEGLESGANDYLGKPFAREELLARTRVQLKMLEAEEEARSKGRLAILGELAAGIAHEVNTPINTIINSSQLILIADSREELEHDATVIRNEGRRIAGIVGGLLAFARRGKEQKAPCAVDRVVSDTVRLIEAKLRKEQIHLLVDIPETIPDVLANPQQMMQVFLNLINNAAHALQEKFPESHGEKTIHITGEAVRLERGTVVRLTFHDRGNGISARIIDKVTQPFFTTKPSGAGTGLGLSITQGIVADHGGTMKLESVEGEFTTVTIELPTPEAL